MVVGGYFWNPENRFIKILYSEIDRIRKNDIKFMGKALFLYAYIKKYITVDIDNEYATKVSFPSENTLSNKSDCGISTVKKYIRSLCDMKMFYMKNYGSYLRMFKGKEIVVNSNNVYALEEKYLDSDGEEALRSYLKFHTDFAKDSEGKTDYATRGNFVSRGKQNVINTYYCMEDTERTKQNIRHGVYDAHAYKEMGEEEQALYDKLVVVIPELEKKCKELDCKDGAFSANRDVVLMAVGNDREDFSNKELFDYGMKILNMAVKDEG